MAVLSADAATAQSRRKASRTISYLTKPLDIRQVLRLVDELLARGAQTTEMRT